MLSDRCLYVCPFVLSCPVLSCLSVTLVYCGQMVGWINIILRSQVGLGPGDTVLDGDPAPPPQRGTAPQFSVHICCGQMAGWIKMPLGMEVGLSPGDLDGDPGPPAQKAGRSPISWPMSIVAKRLDRSRWHLAWRSASIQTILCARWGPSSPKGGRTPSPIFGSFLLWPNGCMYHDATWYKGRPQPRRHCVT